MPYICIKISKVEQQISNIGKPQQLQQQQRQQRQQQHKQTFEANKNMIICLKLQVLAVLIFSIIESL